MWKGLPEIKIIYRWPGSGEGDASPLLRLRSRSNFGSVVIIVVIITREQPTGLGINRDFVGFAVHQSSHLHISALAGDHDAGPSIRLQFRFDLFRGDRMITRDEHRSRLLRPRVYETDAADEQG